MKIPAGVGDGSRVRVAGKGGAGRNGGKPGDFPLRGRVRPHPHPARRQDLTIEVPITVPEAARRDHPGADAQGRVQLKVPAAVRAGSACVCAARARQTPGGEPGDLYARLMVQVPPGDSAGRLADALSELERGAAYGEDRARG